MLLSSLWCVLSNHLQLNLAAARVSTLNKPGAAEAQCSLSEQFRGTYSTLVFLKYRCRCEHVRACPSTSSTRGQAGKMETRWENNSGQAKAQREKGQGQCGSAPTLHHSRLLCLFESGGASLHHIWMSCAACCSTPAPSTQTGRVSSADVSALLLCTEFCMPRAAVPVLRVSQKYQRVHPESISRPATQRDWWVNSWGCWALLPSCTAALVAPRLTVWQHSFPGGFPSSGSLALQLF